jgi:MoaE-MoaD fusion protein
MQLRIRLFANLREIFGDHFLVLDVPDGMPAGELPSFVAEMFPFAAGALANVMVARNQILAGKNEVMNESDDIALIPPVGGGETQTFSTGNLQISDRPLDISEAFRFLEDAHHGGTVLFVGTVREWTGDKQTSHLHYEAYTAMAHKQMQAIQEDVERTYPGITTLQWHRIGELYPTDIAVICGASSAHRKDAFAAANTLIDRLKKEVSIWKKETYVNGDTTWKPNP